MGNLCSKCFKKTSQIEVVKINIALDQDSVKNPQFNTNSNINSNLNEHISPGLNKKIEESKVVEFIKIEENKDQNFQNNRKSEEIK